jgi:broad specificity phosphatase PhoE
MTTSLGNIYLVRHGETEWSRSGQHTGRTDLPLTARGEEDARRLGRRLHGLHFALVLTSPLQRARRTCELAGFGEQAVADPDLREWDYGLYEGRRSADILRERPGWHLFRDGCPGGEGPDQIGARADRVLARIRAAAGDVLLFAHGHVLRVLAARWLGLPPQDGRLFYLNTGALCILGQEHDNPQEPVLKLWNDTATEEHGS